MMTFLLALAAADGALVAVGGGEMPAEVVKRTIALAGGAEAVVVVVPQASSLPEAGKGAAEMWRQAGAREVSILDPANPDPLRKATLVWIGGGDQAQLMKVLAGTKVPEIILERYKAGAVIGGTSAGAACQSKVMITGDATPLGEGLPLATDLVFDQHFLARGRFNRLLKVVLDKPDLVGVGIDEATAVIRQGTTLEVVGKSRVLVLDARKSEKGRNLALHVLTNGMKFELK